MTESDDAVLLKRFAEERDEMAFRELVQRQLKLVYSAALRQVRGDRGLAEEVSQTVFTLLARKAASLLSHPALSGWLFTTTRNCARDAMRETMRKRRGEEAVRMQATSQENEDVAWKQIAPELDDLLHKLGARDRESLVLRFLEEKSYGEVGRALGIGENAARMRVDRALEKLRGLLARRGIASSSAVLTGVLTSHGATAVPVHLAAQIATIATNAVATAAGAGELAGLGFTMMKSTKIAATIAVVACGVAVYEGGRAQDANRRMSVAQQEMAELRASLTRATTDLTKLRERVESADADVAQLLSAIERASARGEVLDPRQVTLRKPTRAEVQKRFEQAQALAGAGQHEAAMKEYLWCFDQGMAAGFTFMNLRSTLIEKMGELAKTYPSMRAALLERRMEAELIILEDHNDWDKMADFGALSRALGDAQKLTEVFTKLPPGDPRRGRLLGLGALEPLIEQRRYHEIVSAKPFAEMSQNFEMMKAALVHDATEEDRRKYRTSLVEQQAKNIEVLAGAGQLEDAKAFAAKLLSYDSSPETRALLRERLGRAGQSGLVEQ